MGFSFPKHLPRNVARALKSIQQETSSGVLPPWEALLAFMDKEDITLVATTSLSTFKVEDEAPGWSGAVDFRKRRIYVDFNQLMRVYVNPTDTRSYHHIIHEIAHSMVKSFSEDDTLIVEILLTLVLFYRTHPAILHSVLEYQIDTIDMESCVQAATIAWSIFSDRAELIPASLVPRPHRGPLYDPSKYTFDPVTLEMQLCP